MYFLSDKNIDNDNKSTDGKEKRRTVLIVLNNDTYNKNNHGNTDIVVKNDDNEINDDWIKHFDNEINKDNTKIRLIITLTWAPPNHWKHK